MPFIKSIFSREVQLSKAFSPISLTRSCAVLSPVQLEKAHFCILSSGQSTVISVSERQSIKLNTPMYFSAEGKFILLRYLHSAKAPLSMISIVSGSLISVNGVCVRAFFSMAVTGQPSISLSTVKGFVMGVSLYVYV